MASSRSLTIVINQSYFIITHKPSDKVSPYPIPHFMSESYVSFDKSGEGRKSGVRVGGGKRIHPAQKLAHDSSKKHKAEIFSNILHNLKAWQKAKRQPTALWIVRPGYAQITHIGLDSPLWAAHFCSIFRMHQKKSESESYQPGNRIQRASLYRRRGSCSPKVIRVKWGSAGCAGDR